MNLSRRQAISAAIAAPFFLAARPALARRAASPPDRFLKWTPIGETAWVGQGHGGNSLLVRTPEGAILIDCKNSPFGEVLRREAISLAGPIALVINTHHHADHTGGNHAFTDDVEVWAHDNCTPRVIGQMNRYIAQIKEAVGQIPDDGRDVSRAVADDAKRLYATASRLKAEQFVPKVTFARERTHTLGGVELSLFHTGPGHTDNDIIVHFPSLNIVHTGDLLFHGMHPFVDTSAGASSRGWQAALDRILPICNNSTTVVPGHGELTDRESLRDQHRYFNTARDAVRAARAEGRTRREVAELDPAGLPRLDRPELRRLALSALFDELAGDTR
jgi:cyclase